MEKNNIPFIDLCVSTESFYEESVDAIVSDLYPDIREIVGVSAKAYIRDVAIQNDRVLITGEIKSEVCFLGEMQNNEEENNQILKMNVILNFARVEEIDAKDCEVFVKCDISKVNAVIINPRKISVISEICLKTDVYKKDSLELNNTENIPYEMKKTMKNIEIIDTVNQNDFTLSDNVKIQINAKNDYELFGLEPQINVTELKVLKNKLMLRGSVDFETGYIDDDAISNQSASVPFSQICDINIAEEDLDNNLDLSVVDFEIENTNENEYYFNLKVKSLFVQYKKYDIECIEDLYSTTSNLDIVKERVEIESYKPIENVRTTQNIEIDSQVENISYAHCNLYKQKNDENNSDLYVSLIAIYNNCHMYQKEVCIYKNINNNKAGNQKVEILGNNQLKLSYDLQLNNSSTVSYDNYMEVIEMGNKDIEKDCIILKHIDNETPLWDLAKEYNSTEEDIKQANGLRENSVSNQMIIIPR